MYKAVELSKYIVSKCIGEGRPISNLQLQKILYYIQKEFLSQNRLAFSDEIEAWQFGPVVPNVYYHYCGFGAMPISMPPSRRPSEAIDPQDAAIIDGIVKSKSILNPWDLVEETHKPDGAWAQIYQNGVGNHHIIPIELIEKRG